jgi:hypothetical protein
MTLDWVTGSCRKDAANRGVRARRAPLTVISAMCSAEKVSARGGTSCGGALLRGESEKIGGEGTPHLRPGRPSSTVLLSIDRNESRVRGRAGKPAKWGRFIPPLAKGSAEARGPTRECDACWLPADEDRWEASLTDDEPAEIVFLLSGLRVARVQVATNRTRQGSPEAFARVPSVQSARTTLPQLAPAA